MTEVEELHRTQLEGIKKQQHQDILIAKQRRSSQLETSFSVWKISFLSSAITTAQMMFAHTRGNVGNEVLIISTASVTERHRCLRLSRASPKQVYKCVGADRPFLGC